MHIERHIYGSIEGYTTLAKSAGLSAEDARLLESGVYGFGQSEGRRYAQSLGSDPAWFTRGLPGGRRGLTRVLGGSLDSAGRATNLMITAVVLDSDWNEKLLGDVLPLLNDTQLWKWNGAEIVDLNRSYAIESKSISAKSADKVAALVSEVERRFSTTAPIVVSSDEFSSNEIRAVEMLIPPINRRQFTSACRALSPQLRVRLNLLASEAIMKQVTFHYSEKIEKSRYARFLLSNGFSSGEIPTRQVMSYRDFARAELPRPAKMPKYVPPPMALDKRAGHRVVLVIIATLLCITMIGGAILIRRHQANQKVAIANTEPTTRPSSNLPSETNSRADVTRAVNSAIQHDLNLAPKLDQKKDTNNRPSSLPTTSSSDPIPSGKPVETSGKQTVSLTTQSLQLPSTADGVTARGVNNSKSLPGTDGNASALRDNDPGGEKESNFEMEISEWHGSDKSVFKKLPFDDADFRAAVRKLRNQVKKDTFGKTMTDRIDHLDRLCVAYFKLSSIGAHKNITSEQIQAATKDLEEEIESAERSGLFPDHLLDNAHDLLSRALDVRYQKAMTKASS